MKNTTVILIAHTLWTFSAVVSAVEDQEPVITDMSEPERCLSLRSIKQIKIIDHRNHLFFARGNKVYQNTLPRTCIGLKPDAVRNYEVVMSQLCDKDLITVNDRFDKRFNSGASCVLGKFQQIPNLEELLIEE